MKIKQILVLLIILVLITQPVSAGFWDWITGRVTEEGVDEPETEPEPEPVPLVEEEPVPEEPIAEEPVVEEPIPEVPVIEEPTIEEPIPEVPAIEEPVPVPPPEPEPKPEPKRVCCAIRPILAEPQPTTYEWRLETECDPTLVGVSYNIVSDEYCEKKEPPEPRPEPDKQCREGDKRNHICRDGTQVPKCECRNNMWICVISPENACPEPPKPKTCAAKIKISFNQKVYSIGDPIKIVIEVFDSQGNNLPNYAFYAQMYDDRWHTPNLERTDNNGYFIQTGTAEKGSGGFTKANFKVYTKEIGSCKSVEDTTEIELRQEEEVCGIGKCVPELEPVREAVPPVVPVERAEIFYPCMGCELEDKCYPFGYRKTGKYCSDNYEFVAQLEEDTSCDNNFECKSNVCIGGECISGGLIKKIIKWFKKFIGKPEPPKPPEPEDEVDCSKLLIENDIGDYEYKESGYGGSPETQAPLYSEDGKQVGTVKCCIALYNKGGEGGAGLVCPYGNRKDVNNLFKFKQEEFVLKDYKGEKVYGGIKQTPVIIIWAHDTHAIAVGPGPQTDSPFPEAIADAYLKKYKNDLGGIELPEVEREAPTKIIDNCREITDADEKVDCYFSVAEKSGEVDWCEKVADRLNVNYDRCYLYIVRETKDVEWCEKIIDESRKEECYIMVQEYSSIPMSFEGVDPIIKGTLLDSGEIEFKEIDLKSNGGYYLADMYLQIKFQTKTKDVTLDLWCENKETGYRIFSSMEDKTEHYEFSGQRAQWDNDILRGRAKISGTVGENIVFNTGQRGTKIIEANRGESAEFLIQFVFDTLESSIILECEANIVSKEPAQSIKIPLNIKYIKS